MVGVNNHSSPQVGVLRRTVTSKTQFTIKVKEKRHKQFKERKKPIKVQIRNNNEKLFTFT
jgi:hypothetical protein